MYFCPCHHDIMFFMENKRNRRIRKLAIYSVLMTFTSVVLLIISLTLVIKKDHAFFSDAKENRSLSSVSSDLSETDAEYSRLITANQLLTKQNKVLKETSTGALFKAKLKEMAQEGLSTTQILKYFFPDELILTDEGSFHFYDINYDLKLHGHPDESFVLNDKGEIEYIENDASAGIKGIDISKYNGTIDWEKVAADGVKFAYIRAGVRGYSSGKIVMDETFKSNVEGASAAGIQIGTYFFSQAVNEEEAIEEANAVLEVLDGINITCPIAYDLEKVEHADSKPRTNGLSTEQFTKNTIAFCNRISEAGYTPMIYGNIKTYLMLLDMTQLEDYQKWFAGYISDDSITPYFPYEMRIWQYTSKGTVDGIDGKCDMNIAFY